MVDVAILVHININTGFALVMDMRWFGTPPDDFPSLLDLDVVLP